MRGGAAGRHVCRPGADPGTGRGGSDGRRRAGALGSASAAVDAAERVPAGDAALYGSIGRRSTATTTAVDWGAAAAAAGRARRAPADAAPGGCAGDASAAGANLALDQRIARLKRFDMNWHAALNKLDAGKLSDSRAGRPRRAEGDDPRQPEAARRRHRDDRRSPAGVAIRAGAGAPERGAHPPGGHQFPGGRRGSVSVTKEIAATRAKVEAGLKGAGPDTIRVGREPAHEGGDRRRRSSQQHDDLVQLLQRLRPAVHVVDGHAVQAAGHGAAGLRRVPARQQWQPPTCQVAAGAGGHADPAGADAALRQFRTSRRSSRCRRTR